MRLADAKPRFILLLASSALFIGCNDFDRPGNEQGGGIKIVDDNGVIDDEPATDGQGTIDPYITNGTVDYGHPTVGIVYLGEGLCTGTLIGSKTVLTAGHCVAGGVSKFVLGGTTYAAAGYYRHPSYGGAVSNDIALVFLQQAVQGITPSALGQNTPAGSQSIELVGYGLTATGANNFGTKRHVTTTISNVQSTYYLFNGSKNICNGDSGGPSFSQLDGVERLVGVHSAGSASGCGITGYDMRVDAYRQWIIENAKGDVGSSTTPTPTPTPTTTAKEGESCASVACESGLLCIGVYNSSTGQSVGKFCMTKCTNPGQTDAACNGGEQCTSSSKGAVCFDSTKPETGYTDPSGSTTPTPTPPTDDDTCGTAEEKAVLALLNNERSKVGARALTCDPQATKAARDYSQKMCDERFFSHIGPDGSTPGTRLKAAGATFASWGENIAAGYADAQSVNNGWMNSSGHKANMLNTSWTRVGIGFVKCASGVYPTYWTEDFVK